MRRKAGVGLTRYEKTLLATLAETRDWTKVADLRDGDRPNESTIYRMLDRFTAHGWVEAKWLLPAIDAAAKTDRPSRGYRLTKDGRTAAKALPGDPPIPA